MFEISLTEVVDSLTSENPWWDEGGIDPRFAQLPRRAYYNRFFSLVTETQIRRATVLMGPRRVGKTVMMHHAIQGLIESGVDPKSILYVSIDTPTYTGLGLEKILKLFFDKNSTKKLDRTFALFDEVQYLRDWEVHLKVLVDKYPNTQFVASGSAAAALKLASQESGAGRFTDFMLPPLTFAEYLSFIKKEDSLISCGINSDGDEKYSINNIDELNKEFINYVNYGGYPEAVFSNAARSNPARYIKSDIIEKVLLRDLPSLYGITNIQELNKLFTSIAYNTGNAVSLEKLSKSSGVSKPTIVRYMEYLEAAFLIGRIKRVDEKCSTFSREREFKVYLTNPSMRAALFHPLSDDSDAIGNVAETALFSQWFHSDNFPSLHYARWKRTGRGRNGSENFAEVDMIYVPSNMGVAIWAMEIKWSDRFYENPTELDGLIEFCLKNGIENPTATTKTKTGETKMSSITIEHVPCALQCYIIGKNTVKHRELNSASAEHEFLEVSNDCSEGDVEVPF
ncbi:ATP-binding protein [Azospirillum melinis]